MTWGWLTAKQAAHRSGGLAGFCERQLLEGMLPSFVKNIFLFIYLFLAVLVLRCRMGFSLVAESRGYSLVAVGRLLIVVASLAAENGWALEHTGFSGCSSRTSELRLRHAAYGFSYVWDLPGPGIKPASPELAGGYFTTEPPRKSCSSSFKAACVRVAGVERKNHWP